MTAHIKPTMTELSDRDLDALIQRLKEAQAHDLALTAEDTQVVLNALMTLASLQERLQDKDVTLHKLRKLLGIVRSSEKLRDLLPTPSQDDEATDKDKAATTRKKPQKKRPPKPQAPAIKASVEHHHFDALKKGDPCPSCQQGKLYKYEPASLLRITGHSPYTPTQHVVERLRCNGCGEVFTAPLPDAVKQEGNPQQKYGYSARSLMAINKYFAGAPFYRQESLQALVGVSISASTVFDQCEQVANACQPVFNHLKRLAADAVHYHMDDTGHRILTAKPVEKKRRNSEKITLRTGVYSSGLIADLDTGQRLVLYQTDIGHAGEWLDDILRQRTPGLDPPRVMSDGLSSNHVTQTDVILTLCNAHGRRKFVDIKHAFPEEVAWVLTAYGKIWGHEDHCRQQGFSPTQRQAHHQEHSLPMMKSLRDWGQAQLDSGTCEANSGLGRAIQYFMKHFDGLTQFCRIPGAQLDNNVMERQLKLVIRNRKNAGFFKSSVGAAVGDVITSVIATTAESGENILVYLTALQRHAQVVKKMPEKWLPWNWRDQ